MKPRCPTLLLMLLALTFASVATANHHEEAAPRVFELRIYHANPGKIGDLLTRFRDHTCGIFERLGIENVGYWVESEPKEGEEPKLYYVIAHPSREAAKEAWATFMQDPEWKSVYAESIKNGRLVSKVESIFLNAVDFSAIK